MRMFPDWTLVMASEHRKCTMLMIILKQVDRVEVVAAEAAMLPKMHL